MCEIERVIETTYLKADQTVLTQAAAAYGDCLDWNEKYESLLRTPTTSRNLNWRASKPVNELEAAIILERCGVYYNDFYPSLLLELKRGSEVYLAREGSVCVYVKGKVLAMSLQEDEHHYNEETDETRLWWD